MQSSATNHCSTVGLNYTYLIHDRLYASSSDDDLKFPTLHSTAPIIYCICMYRISSKSLHSENLHVYFKPAWCSHNLRVARFHLQGRHACAYTASVISLSYIPSVTHIAVNPLPYGEILRLVFIKLAESCSDISSCGKTLRKYGTCTVYVHEHVLL